VSRQYLDSRIRLLLVTRIIAINLNFWRIALPKGCYLSTLNT